MSDSAVLDEPSAEVQIVQPAPAQPVEIARPTRKRKRFSANVRFNGLRYLVLAGSLALAWGLLRAAMWYGSATPEATFMLALAGGLLAAAAKTGIDILNWADANRQAVHVERMHAVQRVFQRACTVRDQAILDWRRIHTVLVDNLTGQSKEIRLFHDHDETDRLTEALFKKALSEDVWIRADGIDAVRRFKTAISRLDYDALATEADFLAAFHAHLESLKRDLAVAAIGIPLD